MGSSESTGGRWTCGAALGVVDRTLSAWFRQLGGVIGRRPSYFIVVPVFLTLLALTGFQQFQYLDDPEYLFSPETGRATKERAQASRLFPDNYTAFSVSRIIEAGQFVRLMVTSVEEGGNLLTEDAFREIDLLDRIVRNITVDAGAELFVYEDFCARFDSKCLDVLAPKLLPHMRSVERRETNLTYPVWFSESFEPFLLAEVLGSPVLDQGIVVSAPAAQMFYWAGNLTYFDVRVSLKWEEAVLANLSTLEDQFQHIRVARFGSQTLRTELDTNTVSILPYLSLTGALVVVFCMVNTMMFDWVRSKPLLGIMGVLSATMASGTAFGLLMYLGVPFIGINLAAPFLMLGIGLDDTFVMLAAWRRTRIQEPVPLRLAETYSESAVSITITSATNVISFLVGAISPFPSVRIFCIYTGLCVLLTYIWHVLFFGACMALSGVAEQRNLHAFTHRQVLPLSEAGHKSVWYRWFCAGGISPTDPWNKVDNKEHIVMRFFRDWLASALNKPAVKGLVLVSFMVYLGIAVWGCFMVQEGLDKRRLARDDSYSVTAFNTEHKYFRDHPYRVQVIIEGEYDYSDPEVQQQVETLLQTFENNSFVEDSFYTESWLRDFTEFVELNQNYIEMDLSTPQQWVQTMRQMMMSSSASLYQSDVLFNASGDGIIATRFIITTLNVNSTEQEKQVMLELREICDQSPLNCTVFNPLFVFFDQFVMVRGISIQAILISAISMCAVSLVFIPNASCALWVAFSIISIEVGVVGYMTHWNVNLDCISMINLIMCIGFSVDFSAHISYAYMSAHGLPADQRVRRSLHALGLPIVQGGASTIVGIATLFLSPSYIYITFFKTNFLVVVFGMMHGLFLLPVLLSLLGPGSRCCPSSGSAELNAGRTAASVAPAKEDLSNGVSLRMSKRCEALGIAVPAPDSSPDVGFVDDREAAIVKAVKALDQVSATSSRDAGLGTSGEDSAGSSSSAASVSSDTPPPPARSGNISSYFTAPPSQPPADAPPRIAPVSGQLAAAVLRRAAAARRSCPPLQLRTGPTAVAAGHDNAGFEVDESVFQPDECQRNEAASAPQRDALAAEVAAAHEAPRGSGRAAARLPPQPSNSELPIQSSSPGQDATAK